MVISFYQQVMITQLKSGRVILGNRKAAFKVIIDKFTVQNSRLMINLYTQEAKI